METTMRKPILSFGVLLMVSTLAYSCGGDDATLGDDDATLDGSLGQASQSPKDCIDKDCTEWIDSYDDPTHRSQVW